MSILLICGSPRSKGNTELLLSMLENELEGKNIETELITLAGKKINHCSNCNRCIDNNKCAQEDDFDSIYQKVLNSDGLILGSPVYVGAPTSLLMAFLQRVTYVAFNNGNPLARKIGGPIVVGGETGHLTTLNCLTNFYLVNEMLMPSSKYWNVGVGVNKGEILNDKKARSYIIRFAQNISWLMNVVKNDESR